MSWDDFLNSASRASENAAGLAPDALFDLAVNRAWLVQQSVGSRALPAWHARTRFARRVTLPDIRAALGKHPGPGEWHWNGGKEGHWQPGKAAFP